MASRNTYEQKISLDQKQLESLTPHHIGRMAETLGAEYLELQSHSILFRNWRCRAGELDIISQDGQTIVISEVKVRSHGSPFSAYSSVDYRKQQQVYEIARAFCAAERELVKNRSVRIDALRICYARSISGITFRLDHIKNAISHAQTFTIQKKNNLYRKKASRSRKSFYSFH